MAKTDAPNPYIWNCGVPAHHYPYRTIARGPYSDDRQEGREPGSQQHGVQPRPSREALCPMVRPTPLIECCRVRRSSARAVI
jgi:hypothetical protein